MLTVCTVFSTDRTDIYTVFTEGTFLTDVRTVFTGFQTSDADFGTMFACTAASTDFAAFRTAAFT